MGSRTADRAGTRPETTTTATRRRGARRCAGGSAGRPLGEPGHDSRVARLAWAVAGRLAVIDPDSAYRAGLYHDIGKSLLPFDPTRLRRPLTPGERHVVRYHPLLGAAALRTAGEDQAVVLGALCHHERLDGSGYPFGLAGAQVPLVAQVVGAADLYDALRSSRSYKGPWSRADVLAYGAVYRGRWFLPRVWNALVAATEPPARRLDVAGPSSGGHHVPAGDPDDLPVGGEGAPHQRQLVLLGGES